MGAMNGLKAVAVALVLFTLAFGSGYHLLFRLGYAVLAFALIGLFWTLTNLLGLELRRETRTQRAQVGQTLEERLTLRNRLFAPKLWLEVYDHSTLPDHQASRAFALGPRASRTWTVRTQCRRRGKYSLGPTRITSGDPFGLFRRSRRWPASRPLIVYPATVDLPSFEIPLGQLPGGSVLRQRAHHITISSLSIRPYVPGDGLNRIHWPSTARLGTLMAKDFERDPTSDIWILLDGEKAVQAGFGDDSTEEYGVTAAASLAKRFLEQRRAVGLIVYGARPCVLPADRDSRQFLKIMEELAVIRTLGHTPLAEVLAAEGSRFGRNSTVVAITPSVNEDWVIALRYQFQRGVRVAAIVLEASSFGGQDVPLSVANALAAGEWPSFLLRRGDDLAAALASPANGKVR